MNPHTVIWSEAIAVCLALSRVIADPLAILDVHEAPKPGVTVVWSPLFQASWDQLNAEHGGKPTKVVPPNALVDFLDNFTWNTDAVMPDGGYAVFAGPATPDFINATSQSVRERFKVELEVQPVASKNALAVIGIMIRNLSFERRFFRAEKAALPFSDTTGKVHQVQFFGTAGIHSDGYGDAVEVVEYFKGGESFLLRMATNQKNEDLVVFRPGEPLSIAHAVTRVKAALKNAVKGQDGALNDGRLHKNDIVKIPFLTMDAETNFARQLQGARSYAGEKDPWEITSATQITKLDLSEEGARIRVETEISDMPFGVEPESVKVRYVPRHFICDVPFFVFAWRKDAEWPYFASWIDSGAALKTFPKRK